MLPPWTKWWPEQDVASLFPDPDVRARIEREQPGVRLEYFRGSVHAPRGWDRRPCGYLAFGGAYAEETQEAQRRGCSVRTLDGGNLHMVVDPQTVAEHIDELLTCAAS